MLTEGVHSVVDFDQPAAADVGPPRGQAPARQAPPVRLRPRALFLELRRRGPGLRARSGRVDLRRHHPHRASRSGGIAVRRLCRAARSPSCSKAGRRWRRSRISGRRRASSAGSQAVRQSKDPPAFIVLLENGAAMAGIIAAAVGLMLSQLTGDPFFDGAASVVIGIILGLTAMLLAYESKGLLIGEAADPVLVKNLRELACGQDGVVGVGHVLTVHSVARPDHGHDERRLPRRHAGRRSRAHRLPHRGGSARALARRQAAIRSSDGGRRQQRSH